MMRTVMALALLLWSLPVWAATYTLNWTDTITGETSWRVERRTMPSGAYGEVGYSLPDQPTFTDDTVPDTGSYRYRVRPQYLTSYGPYSNEACIPTSCSPSAPTNVTVTGYTPPTAMNLSATYVPPSNTYWSGILAPSRATDWTGAGAAIVERSTNCTTTACNNLWNNGTGNCTNIANNLQSAVSGAPAGTVVRIPATPDGGCAVSALSIDNSNVTIRGAGATQTVLRFTSATGGCYIGANSAVRMCTGGQNLLAGNVDNSATWSAGYTQGTAVVTLSTGANLAIGSTLWLYQNDEPSDGYPTTGNIYVCVVGQADCGNNGTGESYVLFGLVEGHRVLACSPACGTASQTQVTITPGIIFPSFRTARTPRAYWGNASTVLRNTGLENLTIDYATGTGDALYAINATDCWVRGVRIITRSTTGGNQFPVSLINTMDFSFVDNYMYGPNTSQIIGLYQFSTYSVANSLIANNAFHKSGVAVVPNSTSYGNVYAYNYFDSILTPGIVLHGLDGYTLFEGNDWSGFSGDTIHGPHYFETLFRNLSSGEQHNANQLYEVHNGIILYANNRFFNLVGNVIGGTQFTPYEWTATNTNVCTSGIDSTYGSVFHLGWCGTGSGSAVTDDTSVVSNTMRWGNWNSVTSSADTAVGDQTGTQYLSAQNPSSLTYYPSLSSPLQHTSGWPASFYLSTQPSWWATAYGTPGWPAIGPDVSASGALAAPNTATYSTGGHAYRIPSRLCFENVGDDTNSLYASTSPKPKAWNRATCYPGS